jgi:hypothetical protein
LAGLELKGICIGMSASSKARFRNKSGGREPSRSLLSTF